MDYSVKEKNNILPTFEQYYVNKFSNIMLK